MADAPEETCGAGLRSSAMVDTPLPKLHYIIEKAREFDVEVAPSGLEDGNNPADEDERSVIEAGPDNTAEAELRAALVGLNSDERAELLALVWVGRGDYSRDSWDEALNEARGALDSGTIGYLMGTPMLGELIEEGMAEIGTEDGTETD
jgi:hypothetical protein